MIVAQCFVEFIFYSFLGWVWESIYCTAKEKKWADRGFLFGPICPIYGSSVVMASVLFSLIPALSDPSFPIWAIFLLCYVLTKKKLGAGDVKFAFILGLYMTSSRMFGGIFYGSVLCCLFCIVQIIRKKLTFKSGVPMIPFLYMGCLVTYIIL